MYKVKTYKFDDASGLDYTFFEAFLKYLRWVKFESNDDPENIPYLYCYDTLHQSYKKSPAIIKNHLENHSVLSFKMRMLSIAELAGYIPRTFKIDKQGCISSHYNVQQRPELLFKDNKRWIVRPAYNVQNTKTILINDQKLVQTAYRYVYYEDSRICIVMSEYIEHPLTYQGKKVMFRVFVIVGHFKKGPKYDIHSMIKLITAKNPYDPKSLDEKVYRCKTSTTDPDRYLSTHMVDKMHLVPSLNKVAQDVALVLLKYTRPYQETKYGYMIFGINILVDLFDKCWIMDINSHNIYHFSDPKVNEQFNSELFARLTRLIVE